MVGQGFLPSACASTDVNDSAILTQSLRDFVHDGDNISNAFSYGGYYDAISIIHNACDSQTCLATIAC